MKPQSLDDICQKTVVLLWRFFHEKRGVSSIEYGLLAGFIGLGIVNFLYITRASAQIPLLSVYGDIYNALQAA